MPIPQVGEPIHTSDPETPTLRQPAERERQRASLVEQAAASPTEADTPAATPCSGRGALASSERARRFAVAMWPLRERWRELGPDDRRALIERAVREHLLPPGTPSYQVNKFPFASGDPRLGEFSSSDWELRISAKLLDAPTLDAVRAADLECTVYHEARHAEQWYLVARREAATTTSRRALFERVAVRDDVVRAAMAAPLRSPGSTGSPSPGTQGADGAAEPGLVACADAMRTAYIDNRSVRDATIAEISAASADRSAGSDVRWRAASARYRALPEEADAFAAEDRYHASAYAF